MRAVSVVQLFEVAQRVKQMPLVQIKVRSRGQSSWGPLNQQRQLEPYLGQRLPPRYRQWLAGDRAVELLTGPSSGCRRPATPLRQVRTLVIMAVWYIMKPMHACGSLLKLVSCEKLLGGINLYPGGGLGRDRWV